jgi:hypothetical protein
MIHSDSTVAEARAFIKTQDDTDCPVCTGKVKTYKRNLPAADLPALAYLLYLTVKEEKRRQKAGEPSGLIWIHIKDLQGKSGGGDFAKFRHWDLIVAKPNEDDPSKKDSGYWRITHEGAEFVRNRTKISKRILIRMGEFKGMAGTEQVSHKEANKECHFHFQKLMSGKA